MTRAGRVDVHAHTAVATPAFAERTGDLRWPMVEFDNGQGRIRRDGTVSRVLPAAALSIDQRCDELDAAGIGRQVLSLVPPLICDWPGVSAADAVAWARYLNDALADLVRLRSDRFWAMGTVPLNHPDLAVAVLREAKAAGLVGIEIGTTGGGRELDSPQLREFFQAAGELDMLVFVHPIVVDPHSSWTERITLAEVSFGLGMTTDTAIAAARLAFGGVLTDSPGLHVCLAHGGGSFAWVLPRIARLWDRAHDISAARLTERLYVDSVVFESINVRYLVDRLGVDKVLFGTDHPMPGGDSLTGDVLASLSAAERQAVEHSNPLRLLSAAATNDPVATRRGSRDGAGGGGQGQTSR